MGKNGPKIASDLVHSSKSALTFTSYQHVKALRDDCDELAGFGGVYGFKMNQTRHVYDHFP